MRRIAQHIVLHIFAICCASAAYATTVQCIFAGTPSPWVSHPAYYDSQSAAASACQVFAAQHLLTCNGAYSCADSDTGPCSWRAGYIEYWVDIFPNQYQFLYCAGTSSCQDKLAAANQRCGGTGAAVVDQEDCIAVCADCLAEAIQACGQQSNITWFEGAGNNYCSYECKNCPDRDDDGVADSCDRCPDNPSVGRAENKYYYVPNGRICGGQVSDGKSGRYLYAGDYCGYSVIKSCESSEEEYHPADGTGIDYAEMIHCCRAKSETQGCVVEENCSATLGENVCTCPDGTKDCEKCAKGKCECPDTDNDGKPNGPCVKCKDPKCTCPDDPATGQPAEACWSCQDSDGDGTTDDKDTDSPGYGGGTGGAGGGGAGGVGGGGSNDKDGDGKPDDPTKPTATPCLKTVDAFKIWIKTADSFPFNWAFAVSRAMGPLADVDPAPPEILQDIMLPTNGHGQAKLTLGINFNAVKGFVADSIRFFRWGFGIWIVGFHMVPYFLARWYNLHGISK